jgi:hypothetical protein
VAALETVAAGTKEAGTEASGTKRQGQRSKVAPQVFEWLYSNPNGLAGWAICLLLRPSNSNMGTLKELGHPKLLNRD